MNELLLEVKMYLGLNIPDGRKVYEADFREFLQTVVDLRFDGYNITKGEGKWKGESEDCYVLTFIIRGIEEYRDIIYCATQYKREFEQDSVLVTRTELLGVAFV